MKREESPLVSVLMTSYNREAYIEEAIKSIINSHYENWELIICDDCSTDRTLEIARSFAEGDSRIRVFVNPKNLGDYHNRNQAASHALGKYLKYVDSDDFIYPHTLEVMVRNMEANDEAALGITSASPAFTEGTVKVHDPRSAYLHHFFQRNILGHGPSGVIIRKDIFFALGGFSGKRNVSDFELWLKMAARFCVVEMEHGLVYWREHAGQEIRIAKHVYLEQLYKVVKHAMADQLCPLRANERKYLLVNQKKTTIANILMEAKRRKDFGYIKSLFKINQLSFLDLMNMPWYYLATSRKFFWNRKWNGWSETHLT